MNDITNFAIKASIIVGTVTLSIIILAYYLSPQRNCLERYPALGMSLEAVCGDWDEDPTYDTCAETFYRHKEIMNREHRECRDKHSW